VRPFFSTSRRGARRARRAWVTVALAAAIAASMAIVGVLDHRHKSAVMNRLEVDEWYCTHEGTHCASAHHSWDVERRWNKREAAYIAVIAAMAAVAAGGTLAGLRSRRTT
jgi:hypothetical protein